MSHDVNDSRGWYVTCSCLKPRQAFLFATIMTSKNYETRYIYTKKGVFLAYRKSTMLLPINLKQECEDFNQISMFL